MSVRGRSAAELKRLEALSECKAVPKPEPAEEQVEDLLPSFAMHNYMFNRTIYDRDDFGRPAPAYDTSGFNTITPENSNQTISSMDPNFDPADNQDLLVLNRLDRLQRIHPPVEITVVLTSKQPKVNTAMKSESPLREYQVGDNVTGYVILENRYSVPLPFDMFLVCLEGHVGTPARGKNKLPHTTRFLRMFDLDACWQPTDYRMMRQMECGAIDESDGCQYGFDDEKTLRPFIRYKKYFTFTLPKYTLDTACPHQVAPHLKLPPSFGVDSHYEDGRAKGLEASPALGYSRCHGDNGSPMLARDGSCEDLFVSYSVTTQLIGGHTDEYSPFYTPNTAKDYDFIMLKETQHFFRVRTDDQIEPLRPPPTIRQLKQFDIEVRYTISELQRGITRERNTTDEPVREPTEQEKERALLRAREYTGPVEETFTDKTEACYENSTRVKSSGGFFKSNITDMKATVCAAQTMSLKSIVSKLFFKRDYKHSAASSISESRSMSISSDTSTQIASMPPPDSVQLQLDYFVKDVSKKPPSEIHIKPGLRTIEIYSEKHLPVSFDDQFILDHCNGNLEEFKNSYHERFEEVRDLALSTGNSVPKVVYFGLVALSQMKQHESTISEFFEPVTEKVEWTYNVGTHSYQGSLEVPLRLSKSIFKEKYYIPPNFETCRLGRWYQISLDVGKNHAKVVVPIRVI